MPLWTRVNNDCKHGGPDRHTLSTQRRASSNPAPVLKTHRASAAAVLLHPFLQLPPSTSDKRAQRPPGQEDFKRHTPSPRPSFLSLRLLFPRNKSQGTFLSSFRAASYGRLYEKILSRQQKSPIWTLRPASPSPSASSHRHIGTAKRRPPPSRLTRRSTSSFPPSSQPDGKVNTLLTPPTSISHTVVRTATAKKRSASHVKKSVTAVPVSSTSSTSRRTAGTCLRSRILLLSRSSQPPAQPLSSIPHLSPLLPPAQNRPIHASREKASQPARLDGWMRCDR